MMIKKNIYKIMPVVFLIIFVTFVFLTIARIYKINNYDVSITNEIVVTSTPTNILIGTYSTTISGTIVNNTNETIVDKYINVYIKSDSVTTSSSVGFYIDSILPNESYTISKSFVSFFDYEQVSGVQYFFEEEYVKLANVPLDRIIDTKVTFGIFAIIASFGLFMTFYSIRNNVPANKETIKNAEPMITNEKFPKTEQTVEPEKANDEIVTSDKQFVFCQYCDMKFDSTNTKCPGCGSPIKKSLK